MIYQNKGLLTSFNLISKKIHKVNISFSYIENSVSSPTFALT